MSRSLQEQLRALGLAKAKATVPGQHGRAGQKPREDGGQGPRQGDQPPAAVTPSAEDISLAAAYAARQRAERQEAERARQEAERKAREKRERKARAVALIQGRALDHAPVDQADLARHFTYGKKIRRIYVDAERLRRLNAGELGIAQLDGRFYLLDAEVIDQLAVVAPEFVALRVVPGKPLEESDGVPDDLHW